MSEQAATGWKSEYAPAILAIVAVGLVMGGLLIGYEPVGGDPDRIFRPIKSELARSLHDGKVPFWSERMGLGVPLVAESHVGAFYPPNWVLYRAFSVSAAYRLAMWFHYVVLAAATFLYARRIGAGAWGGAIATVSFTFCGFQTIHSSHEWAYQTLAYLPLCLLASEGYAATGRIAWLGAMGLLWGAQLTLGHFQVQMWTGGLAFLVGAWRIVADRRPLSRLVGLPIGLAWGAAIAAVQLVPTWELAQLVGQTRRSFAQLAFYSYPPAHWAELAVPGLFRWLKGGPEAPYWFAQQTTGFEACFFIGTVPLLLAVIGLMGGGRGSNVWRVVVVGSLALATMPRWWPQGYAAVLQLPGLGYFRCPARYTAIASFGLALLAARGLDAGISARRFRLGMGVAVAFGLAAIVWAFVWTSQEPFLRRWLDDTGLTLRVGLAVVTWMAALAAIGLWRRRPDGVTAGILFGLTVVEMGTFYYLGTTHWGWSVELPASSPVLARLTNDPASRRIGGVLDNLPIRAGLATATPYTGFPLPMPYPVLEAAQQPGQAGSPGAVNWLRRLGVTHIVADTDQFDNAGKLIACLPDPALDQMTIRAFGVPEHRSWRVVGIEGAFPDARVATRSTVASDRATALALLAQSQAQDEAWFLPGDVTPNSSSSSRAYTEAGKKGGQAPREEQDAPVKQNSTRSQSPFLPSHTADVVSWSPTMLTAIVRHDGDCDLILNRAYYPGWFARTENGPERPVARTVEGLTAVHLGGSGTHRVTLDFRPNGLVPAVTISAVATLAAIAVALHQVFRKRSRSFAVQASGLTA